MSIIKYPTIIDSIGGNLFIDSDASSSSVSGSGNIVIGKNSASSLKIPGLGISWTALSKPSVLPSFSGNAGKFLSINGSSQLSWNNISDSPIVSANIVAPKIVENIPQLAFVSDCNFLSSTDGTNWNKLDIGCYAWKFLQYGNGRYVAVADYQQDKSASSTDGITWTYATMKGNTYPTALVYGNGVFLSSAQYNSSWQAAKTLSYSTDGLSWSLVNLSGVQNNAIVSLSYGNGVFLAIANGGPYNRSVDGVTWTQFTGPLTYFNEASFVNGMFIVVGNSNLYTSTDTVTWQTYVTPFNSYWKAVKYLNNKYFIYSGNNQFYSSTDLVSWNAQSTDGQVHQMNYINSQYLYFPYSGPNFWYSSDAIKWTYSTTSSNFYAAYTPIANTFYQYSGNSEKMLVSTGNSVSWQSMPPVSGVRSAAPFNTRQSYIGSNNLIPAYVSPIGMNTAIDSLSFTNLNLAGNASIKLYLTNKKISTQKYITIAQSTQTAYQSTDAVTWKAMSLPQSGIWNNIVYGNNIFIAVQAGTTGTVAKSTDGELWTTSYLASTINAGGLVYGNGTFIIKSQAGTDYQYSKDGITWSIGSMPVSINSFAMKYANDLFVAIGYQTNTVVVSEDGISWSTYTLPLSLNWNSLEYGNGTFLAVAGGNTSSAVTSTNGISWTTRTLPSANQWNKIAYGNGTFVVSNYNVSNFVISSTDGITWSTRTIPSSISIYGLTYGNGLFIANGYNTSVAMSSTDAVTWTLRTMPQSLQYSSMTSGHINDSEVVYRNSSISPNATQFIDANKHDPIIIPEGWSLIAQSSLSPVNVQISGERWSNI